MRKIRTKAQLDIGNAPAMVLIIGLTFLVMATIALIGEKYGDSIDTDGVAATQVNQSVTNLSIYNNANYATTLGLENIACGNITSYYNGTGGVEIPANNFTQSGCIVTNASADTFSSWGSTILLNYGYTYSAPTTATNVTTDLQTEIGNNTSIAGIILTISLIGIVLTILIGVFIGVRRGTTRI